VAISQALPSNSSFSAARPFEAAVSDSSLSKSATRRAASSFTAFVLNPAVLLGDSQFAGRARRAFVHGIWFRGGAFVASRLRLAAQWARLPVKGRCPHPMGHLGSAASAASRAPLPNQALQRTRRKRASFLASVCVRMRVSQLVSRCAAELGR
jgi:hypothetical protein